MEVILLQDIDKVGDKFTIVEVKNGFGRNYLIPQGFALIANKANRNKLTELLRQEDRREAKRTEEYRNLMSLIDGKKVRVSVKAGNSGRIFGSVSNAQVGNAIIEQLGATVERKKISLPEMKELGEYPVSIKLSKEFVATVNVEVVAAVAAS
jgi:large subunit ribosomal protein L9